MYRSLGAHDIYSETKLNFMQLNNGVCEWGLSTSQKYVDDNLSNFLLVAMFSTKPSSPDDRPDLNMSKN